ncbi:MAG: MFS transporter [Eubacteriales bacterium]|nr:MFS transporter [Eubacteriales bacterium]
MSKKGKRESGIISVILLTIAASYVYMMNCGIRNNFGVMLSSIIENTRLSYSGVSFVLATGQLCFGITQPVFGIVSDKKGNRFSLLIGISCTLVGVLLLPVCKTGPALMLVLGILLPGGIGAISYGIIISTISDRIPARYYSTVAGIINAGCGIGNTLLTPVISRAIRAGGLAYGMFVLAVPVFMMIPVTLVMCGKNRTEKVRAGEERQNDNLSELFRIAFRDRNYIFIVLGFFTCGFHMAIITNHLTTQIVSYGHSFEDASNAFAVYGIATVLGALAVGALCGRRKMKNVLGTLYGLRAVSIAAFFLLPKTMPVICGYIFFLGVTGASTVSPVSGICERLFGTRGVTVFFGVAFLAHQIGGFLSAWLGGVCFERFGNYMVIWMVDAILCLFAAIVSYLIKENMAADRNV